MTGTQGEVLQQSSAPAPSGQASNVPANALPASNSQAPSPPTGAQQPAGDGAAGGQAPRARLSLSPIIEQQLAQAIQPVLDEFRQNLAQVMDQQTASMPAPATRTSSEGAPQTAPQGQRIQQPAQQQPVGQATQAPQAPQAPQTQQSAQPAGPVGQATAQLVSQGQQGLQAPVTGALRPVLQTVERQSAQWLQSVLVAGLGALLAESTHAAVQQHAEQGLHALLQKLFGAVPDGISNQEIQSKTEQMLQTILRESLDVIFTEGMRGTVQQGSQLAIQESLHGDFGGALGRVQDTLKAMADALLTVLRRQRSSVLRLVLAVILLTLESSLAQSS